MGVKTNNYVAKTGDTMSGTLTMGATAAWDPATGNITTTGTVDGVDVGAHAIATTGVHGVGASTILSAATAASTYLPLAGGDMAAAAVVKLGVDNSYWYLRGGSGSNKGSGIVLIGKDQAQAGALWLFTSNAASTAEVTRLVFSGTVDVSTATFADTIVDVTANAGKTVVFRPPKYTTANAPTSTAGNMYFDTTLNKLRVRGAAGWETVTSV